jgi:hypothetical protein
MIFITLDLLLIITIILSNINLWIKVAFSLTFLILQSLYLTFYVHQSHICNRATSPAHHPL